MAKTGSIQGALAVAVVTIGLAGCSTRSPWPSLRTSSPSTQRGSTPPAGATSSATADVAGAAATISDGIAYWSLDGWDYALKTSDGGDVTTSLDSFTSVDPPS